VFLREKNIKYFISDFDLLSHTYLLGKKWVKIVFNVNVCGLA